MRRTQLLLSLVAAAALATLAFAPTPPAGSDSVVLLTPGATPRVAAEGGVAWSPRQPTFALPEVPTAPRWAEPVPDAGALSRRLLPGQRLKVVGDGLEPWDTERLAAGAVGVDAWAAGPPPEGIVEIGWRRDLVLGDSLIVSGLARPGSTELMIRLVGGDQDAGIVLPASAEATAFRLELRPPAPGHFRFDLVTGRDETDREHVGVVDAHVREDPPPTVLWLERAPSFETRHVKRWLARLGGGVAIRSPVSRGRHRYEFLNLERLDLSRITPDRLAPFEVIVADTVSWHALSDSERRALELAVRSGESGLVLRLDPTGDGGAEALFGVRPRRIDGLEELMLRPVSLVPEAPSQPLGTSPFDLDHEPEASVEPLLTDGSGRILALRRPLGKGSVALTTVRGSYRWELLGRADVHRAYWTSLLDAVAPEADGPRWLIPPGPTLVDESIAVTLATSDLPTVTLTHPDGRVARVPMGQHPTRPDRFGATLWPPYSGWYELRAGDAIGAFHADAADTWGGWRTARKRRATAAALAAAPSVPGEDRSLPFPWVRLLALTVLLASLTLAWIDERRGR